VYIKRCGPISETITSCSNFWVKESGSSIHLSA
jgi:hypothetical protein